MSQLSQSTTVPLTFGHPIFITNSRGELVSAAGAVSNGGHAGNNGGKLSMLLVLFFLISNFVLGVHVSNLKEDEICVGTREVVEPLQHVTSDGQLWFTFENADLALNYVESLYLNGTNLDGVKIFCNDTKTALEDFVVTPDNNNNTGVGKRWSCSSAPLGTHFTQRQVADSGIWYTRWARGGCGYNYNSNYEAEETVSWSTSTSVSLSADFDFGLAETFGAAVGVVVTRTDERSGSWDCHVGPHDVVSVWTQAPMWYSDQQTQRCVREYYGKNGCKCGAWSAYIHGDTPAKNKPINFGCSTGGAAQC